MTWLERVVDEHKEFESPKSFWFWSALCAISAVVKDNVWMDCFVYNLYPNIYVLLHAASGMKKGPPVNMAKDLVKKVNNTKLISGRSSIQGILGELGTGQSKPGGKIDKGSTCFISASEFSSSLVNDPAAMTILTDLYDRNYNEGEWKSLLKMEKFSVTNATVTMLVATNKAHFDSFLEKKDVEGGFIGRTFIIDETKVQRLNSLIKKPAVVPDREELAKYLKILAELRGPFASLDGTPAGEFYDTWYNDFYTQVSNENIEDPTGTINRFGDSVKKVAMLLSLGESPELVIEEKHIRKALEVCEKLIAGVRKSTMGKERKEDSNTHRKTIAINALVDCKEIKREVFLRKYWMHGNSSEWDEAMLSLEAAGMIEIRTVPNQGLVFVMPDKVHEEMLEFLEGKKKK